MLPVLAHFTLPHQALELLGWRYSHWGVREFAIRILATVDDHQLSDCIPQLVQVLRADLRQVTES